MSDWNGRTAPDAAEIEAMARHAMTTILWKASPGRSMTRST